MLEPFSEPPSRKLFDLRAFDDLVGAGIELIQAQFGAAGLEPISRTAGRLLLEQGAVRSVDDGIVVFHERITRDKPSLRRLFRRIDTKAGRRGRRKPLSPAQRAVHLALRAGQVKRVNGKIAGLTPKARREVNRLKRVRQESINKRLKKQQSTALARMQGIGGKRGKPRR